MGSTLDQVVGEVLLSLEILIRLKRAVEARSALQLKQGLVAATPTELHPALATFHVAMRQLPLMTISCCRLVGHLINEGLQLHLWLTCAALLGLSVGLLMGGARLDVHINPLLCSDQACPASDGCWASCRSTSILGLPPFPRLGPWLTGAGGAHAAC